ncbi:MAG: hypothetical protein NTX72_01165 [Candidatus Uhrbacteria bacterium]|nr:hypothetical protein [Candidatus Uhrbacteria bacterium]
MLARIMEEVEKCKCTKSLIERQLAFARTHGIEQQIKECGEMLAFLEIQLRFKQLEYLVVVQEQHAKATKGISSLINANLK